LVPGVGLAAGPLLIRSNGVDMAISQQHSGKRVADARVNHMVSQARYMSWTRLRMTVETRVL